MSTSQTSRLSSSCLQPYTSYTAVDDTLRRLDAVTLEPVPLATKGTLTSSSARSPVLFPRSTTEIEGLWWSKPT